MEILGFIPAWDLCATCEVCPGPLRQEAKDFILFVYTCSSWNRLSKRQSVNIYMYVNTYLAISINLRKLWKLCQFLCASVEVAEIKTTIWCLYPLHLAHSPYFNQFWSWYFCQQWDTMRILNLTELFSRSAVNTDLETYWLIIGKNVPVPTFCKTPKTYFAHIHCSELFSRKLWLHRK